MTHRVLPPTRVLAVIVPVCIAGFGVSCAAAVSCAVPPDKSATIMLDVHYRAVQTGAVGKTQVWTDGVSLREV